jgi:hypothetical protein
MISAGHSLAAAAGYRILEDGGNAIDAGVASGIVINTVLPENTSFGGVAPIMIYDAAADEVVTISGLGRWPRKASAEFFIEQAGGEIPVGILRSIVPAAADAWLTALERYGTMSFEQVVTPALELAEDGMPFPAPVHRALRADLDSDASVVRRWPSTSAVFLPDGRLPAVGERFRQPDLARTFGRMVAAERSAAAGGREEAVRAARDLFYRGEIAKEMAAFSEQEGGDFVLVVWRSEPVGHVGSEAGRAARGPRTVRDDSDGDSGRSIWRAPADAGGDGRSAFDFASRRLQCQQSHSDHDAGGQPVGSADERRQGRRRIPVDGFGCRQVPRRQRRRHAGFCRLGSQLDQ